MYECPSGNYLSATWNPERDEVELTVTPGHHDVEELNAVPLSLDVRPEHLPLLAMRLLELHENIQSGI